MSAQAASRRVPTVIRSCVACGGTGGQNVPVPAYVEMDALGLPGSPSCCTPVSSTVVTPGGVVPAICPYAAASHGLQAVNVTGRSVVVGLLHMRALASGGNSPARRSGVAMPSPRFTPCITASRHPAILRLFRMPREMPMDCTSGTLA